MKVIIIPAILSLLFGVGAAVVNRAENSRVARRQGIAFSVGTIAIAFLSLLVDVPINLPTDTAWLPRGMLSLAPLTIAIVALIAVGIAPVSSHRRASLKHMMVLFAFAEAFLVMRHPVPLVILWSSSSLVAWAEFRTWCLTTKWHRVFALYHIVSLLLFASGAFLVWREEGQKYGVILLLLGIAIREGVIPLHSWFPSFATRAPMGVVVAFAVPQLGVYAQLELIGRLGLGEMTNVVAVFGAFTAVLAAMLGVVQIDVRRAMAYLIMSQTGLVAFGLESHSSAGFEGAILNWQVLALATSGLAMTLSALQARRGAIGLKTPQGSFAQTPLLGIACLILGFASVGFPMTVGFVAEDLLIQGTVSEFPILSVALVVATAFNGVTVLRMFFYLFAGQKKHAGEQDIFRREGYILGLVISVVVVFGFIPQPLVSFESSKIHVTRSAHGSMPINGNVLRP